MSFFLSLSNDAGSKERKRKRVDKDCQTSQNLKKLASPPTQPHTREGYTKLKSLVEIGVLVTNEAVERRRQCPLLTTCVLVIY